MASRVLLSSLKKCSISNSSLPSTYCRLFQWNLRCASGAVGSKKAAKGASLNKKKELEVETDAKILCSRLCGGNIYKEGEDPVLGPDSDYPDWLWDLRLERTPVPLEEMSQDDPKYWQRLKKLTMKENARLRKHAVKMRS